MLSARSEVAGALWPGVLRGAAASAHALVLQLEHSQWLAADALWQGQRRQLAALLGHAARQVPFYRDRLGALAGRRLDRQAWQSLPVLERAEVQAAGEALFARATPRDHGPVAVDATSGSLGQPLRLRKTALAELMRAALNLRAHLWHRRDFAATLCTLRRLDAPARGDRRWALGVATGPSFVRDAGGPLDDHLAWLAAKRPGYLVTYATLARALAERARERGLVLPDLRQVGTMGEALAPEVREAVRAAWDVPVVDLYSARECGPIALQCPEREHYHVQAEAVLVELLDDRGRPVAPGEAGRVVVTPLHNFAMPLVRYAIGDHAVAGAACPCGRGLPVLERILGRSRNMAVLPTGARVWPKLSGARLMACGPIRRYRLVQRERAAIEVALVAERPLDAAERRALAAALAEAFGHPFRFDLVYCDDLPRDPSGKFEDFRCEIAV